VIFKNKSDKLPNINIKMILKNHNNQLLK